MSKPLHVFRPQILILKNRIVFVVVKLNKLICEASDASISEPSDRRAEATVANVIEPVRCLALASRERNL